MLGSQYAPARDYHADEVVWWSPELSFRLWRQEKSKAKEEKLQRMKGLFSGKVDKQGPSLIALLTSSGCLEAHLGDAAWRRPCRCWRLPAEGSSTYIKNDLMASPARKKGSSLAATV